MAALKSPMQNQRGGRSHPYSRLALPLAADSYH